MIVHKLGHACLLVEEAGSRVLIDPGAFSSGFEDLRDLDAILITHAHPDHLQPEAVVALLRQNPGATVVCDAGSARPLTDAGVDCRVAAPGEDIAAGASISVIGERHAVIHPDLEPLANHGYLVAGRLFHPGDALTVPSHPVEVLALPIGAPWLKTAEAVDYVRAVRPTVAIPIHDAVLAKPEMVHTLLRQLKPEGTEYRVVADGDSTEI